MKYYSGVGREVNSAEEARIWNRTLHSEGFRCCHGCFEVFPKTTEYFHIKCGSQLNSRCKTCAAIKARRVKLEQKNDPIRYCSRLATGIKARSKDQGLPFNLTGEYKYSLLDEQGWTCYYTKKVLDFTLENKDTRVPHRNLPSIDRLNPSDGYVEGNVRWCLYYVNRMKNDLSEQEFIQLCRSVVESFTRE